VAEPQTVNPNTTAIVEVRAWFERYHAAWLGRDADAIAALISPQLHGTMVMMDGATLWSATRADDLSGVRSFFDVCARHRASEEFEIYAMLPRGADEVVALTRKTVSIHDGDDPRAVTQFAVETLRRDPDGEWRLVRYWAEKVRQEIPETTV
jgi:ketosteroid isomerase-like protein